MARVTIITWTQMQTLPTLYAPAELAFVLEIWESVGYTCRVDIIPASE